MEPYLITYNSLDDTENKNCYDIGRRKHILEGKNQFVVLKFEACEISF